MLCSFKLTIVKKINNPVYEFQVQKNYIVTKMHIKNVNIFRRKNCSEFSLKYPFTNDF